MKKFFALLLAVCLVLALCACGAPSGGNNSSNSNGSGNSNEADKELTPAEMSDKAMENFVKKLQAGNYTATGPTDISTNAVSPETVYFQYPHEGYPTTYAYMTLNGETFAMHVENNEIEQVEYISRVNAIDAVAGLVPNNWITVTGGNMFELFYNDPEKPLEFTSNDQNVKYTVCCLAGYGEFVLGIMEEVRMIMDAVDPSSVRFTAVVPDQGMIKYDDIDVTLKFGEAAAEPHIENWYKSPVYPPVRTDWTKLDLATLGNVFMRDYGREAVPFPPFASYTLSFDPSAYEAFNGIRITDDHATEKDVEDYKALLLKNGFTAVEEKQDDGSNVTVYRKLLREYYHASAELYPRYDNGFELIGMPYYEDPSYEGLEAISALVQEHGFAPLPDTDLFSGWSTTDEWASRTEGFAYFYEYDMYAPFLLSFTDAAAAESYWKEYGKKLEEYGFAESFVAGENRSEYKTPDGDKLLRVTFSEDNTVAAEFKSSAVLSADEANRMLEEHGIPAINFSGFISGRDMARYRYEISGFIGMMLTATQQYKSNAEAEQFLDSYVATLEDRGFLPIDDPQRAGSSRQYLFMNQDIRKYVGFDYYPGDNGASVLFECFSAEGDDVALIQKATKWTE